MKSWRAFLRLAILLLSFSAVQTSLFAAGKDAKKAENDPIPRGSEWQGHASREDTSGGANAAMEMTMKVTARQGAAFRARVSTRASDNTHRIVEVEGEVDGTKIYWRTTKLIKAEGGVIGKLTQGTIEDGKITASFDRRTKQGHVIKGTVELALK